MGMMDIMGMMGMMGVMGVVGIHSFIRKALMSLIAASPARRPSS